MKSRFIILPLVLLLILFSQCTTVSSDKLTDTDEEPKIEKNVQVDIVEPEELDSFVLTFAGDIMAHNVNFNMKDYSVIYQDVSDLFLSDDLTFGNLETPITDSLPLSTYPNFNVHSNYLEAAVEAGFDIFALANNHSNDQGLTGIDGTLSAMENFSPSVLSSGLKINRDDPFEPIIIEAKGWKIGFLSVTEIFNAYDTAAKRVNYVPPTLAGREHFLSVISTIQEIYQCDTFILGIHTNEPEYVLDVSETKRKWFSQLCEAGVDIVWAHHPHVMQTWETISVIDKPTGKEKNAFVMYSMGNFVSGQRYTPNIENPAAIREYTGDSVLMRLTLNKKDRDSPVSYTIKPILITNVGTPGLGVRVHLFDENFIAKHTGRMKEYYQTRFNLMHEYLPLLPMKQVRAILE